MTAGPSAGPASAYPTFSTPASICFSVANDVLVPGLILGSSAGFALPDWALAEPLKANWAAAMVMAAVPKKRRRSLLMSSDILKSLWFEGRPGTAALSVLRWTQRPERRSHLRAEELRLFPRREVTALVELVVINELGIRLLCPTPWSCIDLVWKYTHGSRDRHTFRSEKGQLAFPIETSGRNRRIRQPVERHIVEDVVAREAFTLAIEDACDERITAGVVVEHPGGKADRGILDPVQRLRTVRHLLGVTKPVLVEKVELIPRMLLVGREAGRGRFAELESLRNVGWDGGRHVGVDAQQFRRCLQSHLLRDRIPPIAALRHKSRVSEALHQHGPRTRDADRVPAGRGRLA